MSQNSHARIHYRVKQLDKLEILEGMDGQKYAYIEAVDEIWTIPEMQVRQEPKPKKSRPDKYSRFLPKRLRPPKGSKML